MEQVKLGSVEYANAGRTTARYFTFAPHVKLRDVVMQAMGKKNIPILPAAPIEQAKLPFAVHTYVFIIRKHKIQIDLPADLSKEEINTIVGAIR